MGTGRVLIAAWQVASCDYRCTRDGERSGWPGSSKDAGQQTGTLAKGKGLKAAPLLAEHPNRWRTALFTGELLRMGEDGTCKTPQQWRTSRVSRRRPDAGKEFGSL